MIRTSISERLANALIDNFNIETHDNCVAEKGEICLLIEQVLDEFTFHVFDEDE